MEAHWRKPQIFLSSVFKDRYDRKRQFVPLRKKILECRERLPVELWAYEIFWPEGTEDPKPDADKIFDRCFNGIRQCDLFVFLLTGRHGSGVEFVDGGVLASYLELEIFSAAILRKPLLVLHERGRQPQKALRDTLELLRCSLSTHDYYVDDLDGLYDRFLTECERLVAGDPKSAGNIVPRLPEWLSGLRSQSNFASELANPTLHFLDGNFQTSRKSADVSKAQTLLDQVSTGLRGKTKEKMPHGVALFRIWAAIRELLVEDRSMFVDPLQGSLMDRALGLWASHASWFSLHGHLWMSPLAAVQSQMDLRTKFASEPSFRQENDVREPLGARASALYSIAGCMTSVRQRLRHYRLAAAQATLALDHDNQSRQGVLLIRGHAAMRMAQLGLVWKLWDAYADFKDTVNIREASGASEASVGEAKVALGLCLVLLWRRETGLSLLREGIDLLRSDQSVSGLSFLSRGLRNLEYGARKAGQTDIAEEARIERLNLAVQIEAMDQFRQV